MMHETNFQLVFPCMTVTGWFVFQTCSSGHVNRSKNYVTLTRIASQILQSRYLYLQLDSYVEMDKYGYIVSIAVCWFTAYWALCYAYQFSKCLLAQYHFDMIAWNNFHYIDRVRLDRTDDKSSPRIYVCKLQLYIKIVYSGMLSMVFINH